MPKSKVFEVRDRATFIPVLATPLGSSPEPEGYLERRAGFGQFTGLVVVTQLLSMTSNCDAFEWPNRTMHEAHKYIKDHFNELQPGQVIDVEYILGETEEPKVSERLNMFNVPDVFEPEEERHG